MSAYQVHCTGTSENCHIQLQMINIMWKCLFWGTILSLSKISWVPGWFTDLVVCFHKAWRSTSSVPLPLTYLCCVCFHNVALALHCHWHRNSSLHNKTKSKLCHQFCKGLTQKRRFKKTEEDDEIMQLQGLIFVGFPNFLVWKWSVKWKEVCLFVFSCPSFSVCLYFVCDNAVASVWFGGKKSLKLLTPAADPKGLKLLEIPIWTAPIFFLNFQRFTTCILLYLQSP